MRRSDGLTPHQSRPYRSRHASRHGYTLVEILTATLLMIIIMMAVTVIFASVTESIGLSRATLEMSQRLRSTAAILGQDLKNVTATTTPPLHPRDNSGYLQYVEGPIGPVVAPSSVAWNGDLSGPDTTVGDIDDILMLTVTTEGEPYVGLINGQPATSNSAEIIWFIRGRTLYRRVLLIKPEVNVRSVNRAGFYATNDLSVHKIWENQTGGLQRPILVANSLADLTQPKCRFAHHPDPRVWTRTLATTVPSDVASTMLGRMDSERFRYEGKVFPFHVRPWMGAPFASAGSAPRWVPGLGLPILAEMSTPSSSPAYAAGIWMAGDFPPSDNVPYNNPPYRRWGYNLNDPSTVQGPTFIAGKEVVPNGAFDAWANEHPWNNVDPITGAIADYRANATRIGDDVILTNVIGFDIKAWDPHAPILTVPTPDPLFPDVVLMPGDPGYIDRVRVLQQTVRSHGLTASLPTGAYADLNYLAKVPYRTWDHDGSASTANVACYPDGPATHPTSTSAVLLQKPDFARQGNARSLAYGTQWEFAIGEQPYPPDFNYSVTQPFEYFPAVYDTWSVHFEYNRHTINYVSDNPTDANRASYTVGNEDEDGTSLSSGFVQLYDEGSNGLDDPVRNLAGQVVDDNGDPVSTSGNPPMYANGVDDVAERETQPPYAVPLQGIQIRIRVFEPGSRQVREVTLIQKFRTK